jgi:hypothetical protein
MKESFPGVVRDSSLGRLDRGFFISFQSDECAKCSMEVANAKQTDTIMSMSKSLYYQGHIWITMTSTMDLFMTKQVPSYIITIHDGMTASDYCSHFETNNYNFGSKGSQVQGDIKQLLMFYHGHTMDMSGAMYNGFVRSFHKTTVKPRILQKNCDPFYLPCMIVTLKMLRKSLRTNREKLAAKPRLNRG